MSNKRYKMLPLLYGEEICAALDYDVMLRDAYRNGVITHVVSAYPPTEGEKETYRKFMYLKTSGYIDYAQQPNTFRITESGKIFLSRGGFTGEVKKSKHAIMAFTISLISLLIAAMSFLFHFLCRE